MPEANGWAKGDGAGPLELLWRGHREEQGENHHDLGKKDGTQEQQEIKSTSHVRICVSGHWLQADQKTVLGQVHAYDPPRPQIHIAQTPTAHMYEDSGT